MESNPTRHAQDYRPGDVFALGPYDVTEQEIVEFARRYDPFPFHVDAEAARKTIFGGLISSGWLTALVWLRLMHRHGVVSPETVLGSPGHEELNWPKPVRPGDRLHGTVEIKDSRVSKSKPGLGLVRYTATLFNQDDEPVFVTTSTLLVKARDTPEQTDP